MKTLRFETSNMIKTCQHCGREFDDEAPNAKYCLDCRPIVRREQIVRWREANREHLREYRRKRHPRRIEACERCGILYEAHGRAKYCTVCRYEARLERNRKYYYRHREHYDEYRRQYRKVHREQICEYLRRYRERVKLKLIREILSAVKEAVNLDN